MSANSTSSHADRVCPHCETQPLPLNARAGKCKRCPKGFTSTTAYSLCHKCAGTDLCMSCGDARENRDAEATNHVVRTTAALTKPKINTLWLMGINAHTAGDANHTFLVKLTPTQAVRLRREKWITAVTPESIIGIPRPVRPVPVAQPGRVKLPAVRKCKHCGRPKNNANDLCKCTMMGGSGK